MNTKLKSGARAIADVDSGRILASVEIAAPPERVFRALSSEEIIAWWGTPEEYRTTEWAGDVRTGGHFRAAGLSADGNAFAVEGEYLEVSAPHKLVQTWKPDWDGGHTTTLTYHLEAIEGGTRVTLRHEGFGVRAESCRGHAAGWERVLSWLTRHSTTTANAALRYFVCRLFAPRPTFVSDMNAEEAAMMRQHVAYWSDLLKHGTVVVFGPVADPQGPWGLGVVRVLDEEALRALQDNDPVMLSGRGFRYEILPMIRAVAL